MLTFERLLIPIDFSRPSMKTLDDAVDFNRPYSAQLTILYVVERGLYGTPLLEHDPRELAKEDKLAAEKKMVRLASKSESAELRAIHLCDPASPTKNSLIQPNGLRPV